MALIYTSIRFVTRAASNDLQMKNGTFQSIFSNIGYCILVNLGKTVVTNVIEIRLCSFGHLMMILIILVLFNVNSSRCTK